VKATAERILRKDKQYIMGTALAVTSIMDGGKAMSKLFNELDTIEDGVRSSRSPESAESAKESKRKKDLEHSMGELNKLRGFLSVR